MHVKCWISEKIQCSLLVRACSLSDMCSTAFSRALSQASLKNFKECDIVMRNYFIGTILYEFLSAFWIFAWHSHFLTYIWCSLYLRVLKYRFLDGNNVQILYMLMNLQIVILLNVNFDDSPWNPWLYSFTR